MTTHPIHFNLRADLFDTLLPSEPEHRRRLALYVERVNDVFAPCERRFELGRVERVAEVPQGHLPLPEAGLSKAIPEVIVHVGRTLTDHSAGGAVAYTNSGDFIIWNTWWKEVYDWDQFTNSLEPFNDQDAHFQIYELCHELGHCWGCGVGEWYNIGFAEDKSNIGEPLNLAWTRPDDPFYRLHEDWRKDPMLQVPTLEWSRLHREVIRRGTYRIGYAKYAVPMSRRDQMVLRLVDPQGYPIDGAGLTLYRANQDGLFEYIPQEEPLLTAGDGMVIFAFAAPSIDHALSSEQLRLAVFQWQGHIVKRWIAIYEAQEDAVLTQDHLGGGMWDLGEIVVDPFSSVSPMPVYRLPWMPQDATTPEPVPLPISPTPGPTWPPPLSEEPPSPDGGHVLSEFEKQTLIALRELARAQGVALDALQDIRESLKHIANEVHTVHDKLKR